MTCTVTQLLVRVVMRDRRGMVNHACWKKCCSTASRLRLLTIHLLGHLSCTKLDLTCSSLLVDKEKRRRARETNGQFLASVPLVVVVVDVVVFSFSLACSFSLVPNYREPVPDSR